jgi:hypothetical protein
MPELTVNDAALTVRAPVSMEVAAAERELAGRGLALGEFHPPIGSPGFTFAGWLKAPLIPAHGYDGANLLERLVSIEGRTASGVELRTNPAPRSAAGPDLNFLLASAPGISSIEAVSLRVLPAAVSPSTAVYEFKSVEKAVLLLGGLAHAGAHFRSARFFSDGVRNLLLMVHDAGSDLGRARRAHCERLIATAGGAGTDPPAEGFPESGGDAFEAYARYPDAAAFPAAWKVLSGSGVEHFVLYRYGREGVSMRYPIEALGADRNRVLIEAGRAAGGRGGMMVMEGGALGTDGGTEAVERIARRISEAVSGAGTR